MQEYMSSETVYVYIFTYVLSIIILWFCLLFIIPRYCSKRRQDIHSPGNASPTEVEVSNALHQSVQVVDPSVHGSDATVPCSGDQEEPEEGQPSAPEWTRSTSTRIRSGSGVRQHCTQHMGTLRWFSDGADGHLTLSKATCGKPGATQKVSRKR